MNDLRASMLLAFVFVVGLGAGIWTVLAPWIIPYPSANGAWTSSTWAATWVGAVVAAASALGLVAALGLAASAGLKRTSEGR